MNNSKFDVLSALILSGEATEKQKAEFEEILKSSKEHQIAYEKLKEVWQTHLWKNNEAYQDQANTLWRRYQAQRQFYKPWNWQNSFFKAAAVILVIWLAFYLTNQSKPHPEQEEIVAINEIIKETNFGEKLRTRLPDGTMVHLNSGSQLFFPEKFTDSIRLVQLIGEGYFDVFEDKARPFTVKTATMTITALGTSFGVNAYDANFIDQVALVSGKLLIRNNMNEEIRLDSGQALTLTRKDFSFSTSAIDYLSMIAWKDGVLNFNNNSFDEIVKTLELNYGVHFIMNGSISIRNAYTGTFRNESLDNVLKVLSFSMNFKYMINGKEVLIESN
jgi:transmembrane sensor